MVLSKKRVDICIQLLIAGIEPQTHMKNSAGIEQTIQLPSPKEVGFGSLRMTGHSNSPEKEIPGLGGRMCTDMEYVAFRMGVGGEKEELRL